MYVWVCILVHTHTLIIQCIFVYSMVQWNLSVQDTAGTQLSVLYREVYLIQR